VEPANQLVPSQFLSTGINSNRQQRPLRYDFRRSLLRIVRNCICGRLDYGRTNIGQRPIYNKNQATLLSGLFRVL
jgi:capsid protein